MVQILFLLAAAEFHQNAAPLCDPDSGGRKDGNLGLRYFKDKAFQGIVTDLRFNPDDKGLNDNTCYSYEGSFCAPSTGSYNFKLSAKPAYKIIVGNYENEDSHNACRGEGESRSVTVNLNANECISFSAQAYQSTSFFCEEPQMFIYVNGF